MIMIPEEDYYGITKKIDYILEYVEFLKKSDERLITTDELLRFVL